MDRITESIAYPNRMNSAAKKKWLAALRSGKYEQARGVIRADDKFCCLGILCEVLRPGSTEAFNLIATENITKILDGEDFGLLEWNRNRLASMNDGMSFYGESFHPHSFKEIADWIEANL
jgi:hypothetical protein